MTACEGGKISSISDLRNLRGIEEWSSTLYEEGDRVLLWKCIWIESAFETSVMKKQSWKKENQESNFECFRVWLEFKMNIAVKKFMKWKSENKTFSKHKITKAEVQRQHPLY